MEVVSPDDRETVEGLKGAFVTQVVDSEQMSVQHSRMDRPLRAPDHSHEQEEVGYLIEGSLTIHVDDEEHPVEAGKVFRIPGGETHSIENSGDGSAAYILVFVPPRPRPPAYVEE